ncbi:hypothetical protein DN062_15420 [Nitrincola tibetensis]|uniref:Two-component system response regulator NarL n=1 Tax=Nitrincola tibetensis TaxID=2219697 RepID=A0A364NII3_9GAMM|nr:response regulator [Nitrincola tibetensis]RAU16938.1 hypothetical protein DN062_15420 [Nitrincola tibetensis]
MSRPLSLLLIDDHALLRQGLAELLNAVEGFVVLGTAASAEEGLQMAETLMPDIVLLDLHMPGMGGMQALKRFKASLSDALIIVLTASDAQADLLMALSVGADGYLLKHTEPEALVQQLLTCSKQRLLLDPKMQLLDSGRASLSHLTGKCVDEVELTERECQTLRLIAEGMSNKLIARALGISDGTVKIHVKHLLSKLNLHSRLELAAWAHRCGFLERGVSSERQAG